MYPTLSESLQSEWDEAEQAHYEELITEQVKDSWALRRDALMGLIIFIVIVNPFREIITSAKTKCMEMLLQGYNNLLKDIFEEAGLLKSQKVKVPLPGATAGSETHTSLQKCKEVLVF